MLQNDLTPGLEILIKTGKASKKNGGCDASQTSVGYIVVPGRHFLAQVEHKVVYISSNPNGLRSSNSEPIKKVFRPAIDQKVQELVSGWRFSYHLCVTNRE